MKHLYCLPSLLLARAAGQKTGTTECRKSVPLANLTDDDKEIDCPECIEAKRAYYLVCTRLIKSTGHDPFGGDWAIRRDAFYAKHRKVIS